MPASARRVPTGVAIRAAVGLRRALLRLADRVVPAPVVLLEQTVRVSAAQALGTVARLGVADALAAGPRTAAELAPDLGVDADLLHRLLRMLVPDGIVRLDRDGRFALTRLGERLRSDHPGSMRTWVRYWLAASNQGGWARLDEVVRTGDPGFAAANGEPVWAFFASNPDEGRLFAGAMRRLTELTADELVARYPWPASGLLVDVAGGAGTLLARILQARPGLSGRLVEAPLVLEEADGVLAAAGVRERVALVEGDLFGTPPVAGDVVVLKNVLHDWDDGRAAAILRSVRAGMTPGATLVVVELLQERNIAAFPTSLTDVQMAVTCDGGRERSLAELRALLSDAGLTPTTVHRTAVGLALVAARA